MFASSTAGVVMTELGAILLLLALVGRVAARIGIPSIPLYLVAGLALGEGSPIGFEESTSFIRIGADLGVVMLLLLLGLEYTPNDLLSGVRSNWIAGVVDVVANLGPGIAAGLLFGWSPTAALLLGGVTYITSSGIVARLLTDLERLGNRETPTILTVLVLEDIAMAAYLPIVGVVVAGTSLVAGIVSTATALGVVALALTVSLRFGRHVSRLVDSSSSELLLLSLLGLTLLTAGLAEQVKVSAAVGAFLIGLTLSGRIAERGREVLTPLRDLFAGMFFVFFGLEIDPRDLVPLLPLAAALAVATAVTKGGTGWWAARRAGIGPRGRVRAAASLIPRGEFSIVIADIGVAAGVEPELGPTAAGYVLILAIGGSLAMRYADQIPLRARTRPAPALPGRN